MEMHDAWFFIGVFVFIFLIWIATGGPLHPLAFTGPRLAQPQELGGGTYLQLPRASFGIGNSSARLVSSSEEGRSGESSPVPTFVGGSAFGTPSPYRNTVSLDHYVSGAGSTDPKNEYVVVSINQDVGVPINLSEWRLVSDATGNSTAIPKGTETPIAGTVNAAQDIVLSPGMRAIIVSGQSPIGASFRENKCIGYFSTFQTFYPSLSQNCPVPSDELAAFYGTGYIRDPFCIDYVNRLSRCHVALTPPAGASGSCQNFLVKYLNYSGCVDTHKNDNDFLGNTWRVYLGRSGPMWRKTHELVKLLDVNGKTVDAFSY
ncbi:hypothetical protein A2118_01650 [Candidatus Kaiserbacteria bacterium GWA2_50_9]|uniref:LTD domain-containing protein n=1 Tax=Candidatus Kaiserbacteria bacterium GWA2_50_9 TaxID=1798474 RepID=A0A1F6BVJ8_9BACT|nr:MAG: hypothetical protein A2118_01650 [Candidatus Kaiserbacteria bacterium GWA2_50_9]